MATLLLLLLHSLPYFSIVGRVGLMAQELTTGTHETDSALMRAYALKQGLFAPTGVTILVTLFAAVLGVVRLQGRVPPFFHGVVMAVAVFAHVWAWRKGLSAFRELDALTERSQ